jgi:hypothetical protein
MAIANPNPTAPSNNQRSRVIVPMVEGRPASPMPVGKTVVSRQSSVVRSEEQRHFVAKTLLLSLVTSHVSWCIMLQQRNGCCSGAPLPEDRELMACDVWPKRKASILSDFPSRATSHSPYALGSYGGTGLAEFLCGAT